MGIKRTQSITVNMKDGTSAALTGDAAHSVLARYTAYQNGNVNAQEGVTYKDDAGKIQMMRFDCVCGITLGETTEETIPDPVCDPLDCLPD